MRAGLIPHDWVPVYSGASGYSGGGRSMIAEFEDPKAANHSDTAYRAYGLGLAHKHLPEIEVYSRLKRRPLFVPSVGNFRQGMLVSIPLHLDELPGKPSVAA